MVSAAVSSVLYLRDVAGEHTETRLGSHVYYGDAASFHGREFRTRLRVAGNTGEHDIKAESKVCDGLRGDAFVAAQEVGFDSLSAHLSMVHLAASTHQSDTSAKWSSRSLNTNPKNCFTSTVVQETAVKTTRWKYETICATMTSLLVTVGSGGPCNLPQRGTQLRHASGFERFDS